MFLEELEAGVLCGDGAIGTMLLADGISLEHCFEELCVSQPDRIRTIHEAYVGAGARVIETNTFGANAVRLERFGLEQRVAEINLAAVKVAKKAVRGRSVYVAGSVGPLGITTEEATARGIDRAQCFREQITALLEAGVDLIFFETFMDAEEMEIALRAKKELSDIPEICSFSCAPDEARLLSGLLLADAAATLHELGVELVGVNCLNDPDGMLQLLKRLPARRFAAVYPTAGGQYRDGAYVYSTTPDAFARAAREMVAAGVRLIGGCCGTTPSHIAALSAAIEEL